MKNVAELGMTLYAAAARTAAVDDVGYCSLMSPGVSPSPRQSKTKLTGILVAKRCPANVTDDASP